MDINWWQLLIASAGLSVVIGGVFMTYIRAINNRDTQGLVTSAITHFRDNEIIPALSKLALKVEEVALIASRLTAVETELASLGKTTADLTQTVNHNADNARRDLTGLGERLSRESRETTQNQTNLLIKIIEASK